MEELRFKYSGFLQNIDIRIYQSAASGSRYTITTEADIKLPILKKSYVLSTEFDGDQWIAQTPPHEKGSKAWRVERKEAHGDAEDPAQFFMDLHLGEWTEPTAKLAIGDKVVEVDVKKLKDGYEIKRRDKDQKLIVRKDARGISALEIPLPVIGNVVIKRV